MRELFLSYVNGQTRTKLYLTIFGCLSLSKWYRSLDLSFFWVFREGLVAIFTYQKKILQALSIKDVPNYGVTISKSCIAIYKFSTSQAWSPRLVEGSPLYWRDMRNTRSLTASKGGNELLTFLFKAGTCILTMCCFK